MACPKNFAPLRGASKILRPPGGVAPHPINNEPSLSEMFIIQDIKATENDYENDKNKFIV